MVWQPLRQELFRTPLVSFLYERGWRNSFAQAGFPGIEKEYELAMEFFENARGKTVMDLSCGSGALPPDPRPYAHVTLRPRAPRVLLLTRPPSHPPLAPSLRVATPPHVRWWQTTYACTYTSTCKCVHARARARAHARTHTHARCARTHTHARTHKHTHTYTYTYTYTTGLMVRRLAKSQAFGKVIAVDFSESMLEEVPACMDAYMHECMHTHRHTCMHAWVRTDMHACMHACIHNSCRWT